MTSRAALTRELEREEIPRATRAGAETPLGAGSTNGMPLIACEVCGWQQFMLQGAAWLKGRDVQSRRPEYFAARCMGQRADWQQAHAPGIASNSPASEGITPLSIAKSASIAIAFCRN